MKIKTVEIENPAFKPVAVELTFETKAELDALGTLLNMTNICATLRKKGLQVEGLRSALIAQGAEVHSGIAEFSADLKRFYRC